VFKQIDKNMKYIFIAIIILVCLPILAQNKAKQATKKHVETKAQSWQDRYEYSKWDPNEFLAATDKKTGMSGYIDQKGEIVIPFIYEKTVPFWENFGNLGIVKKNGKWGAIDIKGNQIIEHLYDEFEFPTNDKLLKVKLNGKWGKINPSGEIIVPFE
jgi:hypothetical protein